MNSFIFQRIWELLILYQIKHFIADYLFQIDYMLDKGKKKGWMKPLAYHAWVHASFTLIIAKVYDCSSGLVLSLVAIDFVTHFVMDRIKASPALLGRFKVLGPSQFAYAPQRKKFQNKLFWWSLGVDQMVHHSVHIYLIYLIVTRGPQG